MHRFYETTKDTNIHRNSHFSIFLDRHNNANILPLLHQTQVRRLLVISILCKNSCTFFDSS